MSASSSSLLDLVVIWGVPLVLLLLGASSLIRGGPRSIGGALTISSVAGVACGLGVVGLLRLIDNAGLAKQVLFLPAILTATSFVTVAYFLLRGKTSFSTRTAALGVLVVIPVVTTVLIAQQVVYCRFAMCINL